jgi:hypothetical protein
MKARGNWHGKPGQRTSNDSSASKSSDTSSSRSSP